MPAWNRMMNWGEILRPHYETAQQMLGVARNTKLWEADHVLKQIAAERGMGHTFRTTEVGAYLGEAGVTVPDPYFGGQGPARAGCNYCGGCMVGCRHNAKNTLPKNYLYFAEKNGAEIRSEAEVVDVRPWTIQEGSSMSYSSSARVEYPRYAVIYQSSTSLRKQKQTVYAKNVIFAAGVMGTMKLLLHLRDVKRSLPKLSRRLGHMVRTNSEALLGSVARMSDINYSQGLAISSIYNHDSITRVEPVRYPDGSSLMRFLAAPLIDPDVSLPVRILRFLGGVRVPQFLMRAAQRELDGFIALLQSFGVTVRQPQPLVPQDAGQERRPLRLPEARHHRQLFLPREAGVEELVVRHPERAAELVGDFLDRVGQQAAVLVELGAVEAPDDAIRVAPQLEFQLDAHARARLGAQVPDGVPVTARRRRPVDVAGTEHDPEPAMAGNAARRIGAQHTHRTDHSATAMPRR